MTYNTLEGSGIISDLFSKVFPKTFTVRPKQLEDIIRQNENVDIDEIYVCRKPIISFIKSLLNIFSFGQLGRTMEKLGFDKLFHLYMVFKLKNGRMYRIEKNQRVNAYKIDSLDKDATCVLLPKLTFPKTLRQFFDIVDAHKIPNLYHYNGLADNCQKFVRDCLQSNGLYNQKLKDFVMQDVKDLVPSFVKDLAENITDIAGIGDYIWHGGRLKLQGGRGFIDLNTFDEKN